MGTGRGLRGWGERDDKVGPRVHLGQWQPSEGRVLMSVRGRRSVQSGARRPGARSGCVLPYCGVFGVSEQPEEREGSGSGWRGERPEEPAEMQSRQAS